MNNNNNRTTMPALTVKDDKSDAADKMTFCEAARAKYHQDFHLTLYPYFKVVSENGDDIFMNYNLYNNRTKLSGKFRKIKDYIAPGIDKDNKDNWWMIVIMEETGEELTISLKEALDIDRTMVAWFANVVGLPQTHRIWYWAASVNVIELPPVHHSVKHVVELANEARSQKRKIQAVPAMSFYAEI